MTREGTEAERIIQEYARRTKELPADRYSWSLPYNRYAFHRLWDSAIDLLNRHGGFPLNGRRALDVGCGKGNWLVEFVQWGARPEDVSGIDLIEDRVEAARRSLPVSDIRCGDATRLPWMNETFDLATQFTVFSSVLDDSSRASMAREMIRTLKPGGAVLWYDMAANNPSNPNVRGVGEQEIRALFPGCPMDIRRITLAPPVGRVAAGLSPALAALIESAAFLRTHRLAFIRKPQ